MLGTAVQSHLEPPLLLVLGRLAPAQKEAELLGNWPGRPDGAGQVRTGFLCSWPSTTAGVDPYLWNMWGPAEGVPPRVLGKA